MIKEALQYLVSLRAPNRVDIGDRAYFDMGMTALKEPVLADLQVTTLSGFTDLISAKFEDLQEQNCIVHVLDEQTVELISRVSNKWADRSRLITSKLTQTSGFQFGQFLKHENFLIGVAANFTDAGDREYIQKLASSISTERVGTSADDGISQQVGIKAGVALKTQETIRGRVKLAPYRTFREVDQPVSEFVLRVNQSGDGVTPTLALFEADGGKWKLDAIENVARFLRASIKNIPVVS